MGQDRIATILGIWAKCSNRSEKNKKFAHDFIGFARCNFSDILSAVSESNFLAYARIFLGWYY